MILEDLTAETLAKTIDHTLLKPEATTAQIKQLCQEARQAGFASVCVNPCHVPIAVEALHGTEVLVCTVIGFPLGANTSHLKALEAEQAVQSGALEVDMVINIGSLKAGELPKVRDDIKAVVQAARQANSLARVKVILETCLLTEKEKVTACLLVQEAGAHFVKTSTGFSTGGATVEDISLMKTTIGDNLKIKASGGIRDWPTALKMLEAGADRIGASVGVAILQDFLATTKNKN